MKTIIIPFLGTDRETIKQQKDYAKKKFPKYKKVTYKKPKYIKGEYGSFWTYPEIEVNN